MKIKKFLAPTLKAGKELVLRELGDDAVILSNRTIRKPGDSSAEMVEIVAAVDNSPMKQSYNKLPINLGQKKEEPSFNDSSDSDDSTSINKYLEVASQIYKEIGNLTDLVSDVSTSIRYRYASMLGDVNNKLFKALIDADFSEEFTLSIIGKISNLHNGKLDSFQKALESARKFALEHITIKGGIEKGNHRKIFAFIGTTGNGKTTALVKLAIISKLVLEANTLIISADSHKVGGVEQLETYASVASIPFQAVYSVDELDELLKQETNRDIILIDTIGGSNLNKNYLNEIKSYLEVTTFESVFLVQSATVSVRNFREVINGFSLLEPTGLILTKLDEITHLGHIIEELKNHSLSLTYFTNGQKVPEDIEPITMEKLANIILPDTLLIEDI